MLSNRAWDCLKTSLILFLSPVFFLFEENGIPSGMEITRQQLSGFAREKSVPKSHHYFGHLHEASLLKIDRVGGAKAAYHAPPTLSRTHYQAVSSTHTHPLDLSLGHTIKSHSVINSRRSLISGLVLCPIGRPQHALKHGVRFLAHLISRANGLDLPCLSIPMTPVVLLLSCTAS